MLRRISHPFLGMLLAGTCLLGSACTVVVMEKPGSSERANAESLELAGRHEEAVAQYNLALDKSWSSTQRAEILTALAQHYGNGTGVKADPAKRLALLNEAASLGYAPAIMQLADAYRRGEGTAADPARAYYLYSTIADAIPKARLAMTAMRSENEIDPAATPTIPGYTAASLAEIESMVQANDESAMVSLAQFYRRGIYVERDLDKAEDWYRKAIRRGSRQASVELADMWLTERNRSHPVRDALNLLEQAANQDYGPAMQRIGRLYENGQAMGTPQPEEAIRWYRRGYELGDTESTAALAMLQLQGYGNNASNPQEGVQLLLSAAKKGSATAYTELGRLALYGHHGVRQNKAMGVRFLTQGAKLGSTAALIELGNAYRDGQGVARNTDRAISLYTEAANRQADSALIALGDLYRKGQGTRRDPQQAMSYYLKASELGVASAMRRVAWMAAEGNGVEKNPSRALEWMQRAAERGDITASYYTGLYTTQGFGTAKNPSAAFPWFLKAAKGGSVRAMGELAYAYDKGVGVTADKTTAQYWLQQAAAAPTPHMVSQARSYISGKRYPQDKAKGRRMLEMAQSAKISGASTALAQLNRPTGGGRSFSTPEAAFASYQSSAKAGDRAAMVKLADAYLTGRGTEMDMEKALEWHKKAAEKGDPDGMVQLAQSYRLGRGTEPDAQAAYQWYLKAAQAGNTEAQYETGVNYARGNGTESNPEEAERWLSRAEKNGYPGAGELLATLSR